MTAEKIDVDAARSLGFGLADDLAPFESETHTHRCHQILYASSGAMHLEVEGAQWFLPPGRAAWIPARHPHLVRAKMPVELRTVYLDPELVAGPPSAPCVFVVMPVAREMLLYAMRWGADVDPHDTVALRFFSAIAGLVPEWAHLQTPWRLPAARSPALARAMRYALDRLAETPSLEATARVAKMSPRTLARRFVTEANTSWRDFIHTARMLRAMDSLAIEGRGVTETAFDVGFASPGAFTQAFVRFVGETPTTFKQRARPKTAKRNAQMW